MSRLKESKLNGQRADLQAEPVGQILSSCDIYYQPRLQAMMTLIGKRGSCSGGRCHLSHPKAPFVTLSVAVSDILEQTIYCSTFTNFAVAERRVSNLKESFCKEQIEHVFHYAPPALQPSAVLLSQEIPL